MKNKIGTKTIELKIVVMGALALAFTLFAQVSFAQANKWIAPKDAADQKNPVEGSSVVLKDAQKLYTTMCAPCHGDKGRGDGPAAAALNPHPADHSSKAIQAETDGTLFWKMTTGKGAMQAYKSQLTDAQRWALVDYIRTLKR